MRTRNGCGHGKRHSLSVCDIYGIGGLSFLAGLIATTFPATKGGGMAAVQIHAGHVQVGLVALQEYASNLFPFTVHGPLAKVAIYDLVV